MTTLLATLMERGVIDAVIQTQKLDAFIGTPVLATTIEQVLTGAGSVYHQSETLSILNERCPEGVERIALVGTPCQISGLRAIRSSRGRTETHWRRR